MKRPKISIITICFNSEKHIEECICSVLNQNYENKEYIVIDGGSTDKTISILNKYRDKIDYFVSEKDNGISDAFNKGILASTGELIGICNSDDVLANDILSKVAEVWDEETDIYRFNEVIKNFQTGEEWLVKPSLVYGKRIIKNQACHMGCFITKKAYNRYGMYDVNLKSSMDTDLLRRFTVKKAKYKYVPLVVGFFRKGGVSGDPRLRNKERNIIIRRYGGTWWDVFCSMAYHLTFQWTKRILVLIGGDDLATRLKAKYLVRKD